MGGRQALAHRFGLARFGLAGQLEQVVALGRRALQGLGDGLEGPGGGFDVAALFQPGVPGGADVGQLGHFLTTQPRGAAPADLGQAQARGVQMLAAGAQEGAQRLVALSVGGIEVHGGFRQVVFIPG
nr:hypothetical protein [Nitrogeniibacter mangrovi]